MLKEVKIELTNKCSRNCKHCSSNATSSIGNLKVLDFEDVSRIIKEAKLMGADTIVFTGGEPSSIEFCHKVGLDYVSCSPYRVPIARLAAAQAAIKANK